jgi:hypothetical protein
MRRHLVPLAAMLLLAAYAFAVPPSHASPLADDGPFFPVYLPLVAKPPEPTSTPTATPTLTPSPTPTETSTLTPSLTPTETQTFTPSPTATETAPITPSPTPTITPTPTASPTRDPDAIDWDPRLDQRGALIVPAQVQAGEWYWRLVKGVWYGENEEPFAGQHHIFIDTRNQSNARVPGIPIRVTSLDGSTIFATVVTELKPLDPYAANFPMYAVAPAYRAVPVDGSPADAVTNLGLGTIEDPQLAAHTSYGFTWQWTEADETSGRPFAGPPAPRTAPWFEPWPWLGDSR